MQPEARAYPFHAGEQDMYFLAGSWQEAESLGKRMIKPIVGRVHAELLGKLPLLLVTAADAMGRLWASALLGQPGFVSMPGDPSLVQISGARLLDAGALSLQAGQQVGCLGLLPSSRRRVRLNGVLQRAEWGPGGELELLLQVDQCYTNCPKYIQKRALQLDTAALARMGSSAATPAAVRGAGTLGPAQQALIRTADTFFIASSSGPPAAAKEVGAGGPPGSASDSGADGHLPAEASAYGCDVSHRGGMPGFVQVLEGGHVLTWADYEGNFMFNTLGNLLLRPACALLFLDFSSSGALLVAGEAQVLHQDRGLPGAQRAVLFTVGQWAHLPAAVPLRELGEVEYSPFNPA